MLQINMHEAKTNLSSLVAKGETFVIAKAGKPLVTVVPYNLTQKKIQRVGFLKGMIQMPDNFNRFGELEIGEIFGVSK